LLALFRVELCGKKVFFPDAGDKGFAVGRERRNPLCLVWNDIIGVDKIEEITTLYPLKHGTLFLLLNRIPAHMGNLMLWIGHKSNDLPFYQIQSLVGSEFLAFRKKNLKAQADA
jgi:hypothetical protein